MRHALPALDPDRATGIRLTQVAAVDHGLYALDTDGRLWRYYPNQFDTDRSRWQLVPGPQESAR